MTGKMIRRLVALFGTAALAPTSMAGTVPLATAPLNSGQDAAPLVMLVMSRDHTLYYEAYNDASDLDGDGVIDYRYEPSSIDYDGYFNSFRCYIYNSSDERFEPQTAAPAKTCSGSNEWSGDFLNYLTMSRIDLMRKVLYGGTRDVDGSSETVLERSYIPLDAHSWAKQYVSVAESGYDIADYSPFSVPGNGKKHFFGNATFERNGLIWKSPQPQLIVLVNQQPKDGESCDVWNWASTEGPVLRDNLTNGCGSYEQDHQYSVRVQVCVAGKLEANCKGYPSGNAKPIGLLHEFGENGGMDFGLMTGSNRANISGGVLRHQVKAFDEIDPSDGTFNSNVDGIIASLDGFRIRGFSPNRGNGIHINFTDENNQDAGWVTKRPMRSGEFIDWGNPLGEILYESVRYFNDKGAATSNYIPPADSGSYSVNLPISAWDKPFDVRNYCAKPNNLVISDIYPSFDADELPGAVKGSGISGDLSGFNAKTLLTDISTQEGINGQFFIGHSGAHSGDDDGAPTAKTVNDLNSIYGLAPQEPTKEGSYTSAAAAYYGRVTDRFPSKSGHQGIATTVVGISSPLPEINVPIGDNQIRLVPYAKSTSGSGISPTADFQPTNTIVDFYVQELTPTKGVFRINFEDVEQGADHDMDMIVTYTYEVKDDLCPIYGQACSASEQKTGLQVTLSSDYAAGSIHQHAGYVVSGTEFDGIYLDVLDRPDGGNGDDVPYYLDTIGPDDVPYPNNFRSVGSPEQKTTTLGYLRTRNFFPSSSAAAEFLPSPLYYAAKYGGFVEDNEVGNGNLKPDLQEEWDSDGDGVPDNYFPVTNAGELGDSLRRAFENIAAQAAPSISTFNSQFLTADAVRYQSSYQNGVWSGDVKAYAADESGRFSSSPSWSAATQLDAQVVSSRKIYSRNDTSGSVFEFTAPTSAAALAGTTAGLSLAQVNALLNGASGDTSDKLNYLQAAINYLRGDRSNEAAGSAYSMRQRGSVLGDIVHATPYVVNGVNGHIVSKPVVVAGANDGMVHVFDLATGNELVAYLPSAVYEHLGEYPNSGYSHRYYVDGAITGFTDDDGDTTIVGSLGHGAKGVYALDLSDLSSIDASVAKWEITASGDYSDIGYSRAQPTIARLANGKNGVIFPNGFNAAGDGALYIADLDDGSLIRKLSVGAQVDPTGGARSNALAEPAVLDEDGDGIADRIYAGDLYGNMWVFDVRNADPNEWGMATNDNGPLFTAQSPTMTVAGFDFESQSITSRPSFAVHPTGLANGILLSFGTGLYVSGSDAAATGQPTQSFYVIWDKLDGSSIDDERTIADGYAYSELMPQAIISQQGRARTLTQSAVNWSTHAGFYLDLINTQDGNTDNLGERQVTTSLSLTDSVSFTTMTPNQDPCGSGGEGWFMQLNLRTGQLEQSYQFDYIPPAPSLIIQPPADAGVPADPSNPDVPCVDDCDAKQLIFVGDDRFENAAPPLGLLNWRRLF